jgi:hypothetical protein
MMFKVPKDRRVALVVEALKDLYDDRMKCQPEDETDCMLAYLYGGELCGSDVSYDALLASASDDAVLIRLALDAVKRLSEKLRQRGEFRAEYNAIIVDLQDLQMQMPASTDQTMPGTRPYCS